MGLEQLKAAILELSVGSTWPEAVKEWSLENVYFDDDYQTCLCGKYPIKEICELRNLKNREFATVGNCCVKRFLGLPSDEVFRGFKSIRVDAGKSLNMAALRHAFRRDWISEWEFDFYQDIMRKRTLSPKQLTKKLQVNQKIIQRLKRPSPGV
jgi:hypothetical protein